MVPRVQKALVLRAPGRSGPRLNGTVLKVSRLGSRHRRGSPNGLDEPQGAAWKGPLIVLLAFTGTWLGHTLEYLRVQGSAGLARTMIAPVHLYMLPLGGCLSVLALVVGMSWLRSLGALAGRLQQLRQAMRQGRRVAASPTQLRPGPAERLCSLWLVLGLAQLALYLLQENIESVAGGRPAPGLGAVLGQHWAAAPIQLLVACALAGLAVPLICRRVRLQRAVGCHERLVFRLWGRRPLQAPSVPVEPPQFTPHQLWGAQRWQRPPPGLLTA